MAIDIATSLRSMLRQQSHVAGTLAWAGRVHVVRRRRTDGRCTSAATFTRIGTKIRPHLAAVDLQRHVVLDWNPVPRQVVLDVAVHGRTIFAAGTFGTIGRKTRRGIAALDGRTGLATEWNAASDRGVRAILIDGDSMYVSGASNT